MILTRNVSYCHLDTKKMKSGNYSYAMLFQSVLGPMGTTIRDVRCIHSWWQVGQGSRNWRTSNRFNKSTFIRLSVLFWDMTNQMPSTDESIESFIWCQKNQVNNFLRPSESMNRSQYPKHNLTYSGFSLVNLFIIQCSNEFFFSFLTYSFLNLCIHSIGKDLSSKFYTLSLIYLFQGRLW